MQQVRSRLRGGAIGTALLLLMGGVPTAFVAAPASAATSKAPITIAYITSVTGVGALKMERRPGVQGAYRPAECRRAGCMGTSWSRSFSTTRRTLR